MEAARVDLPLAVEVGLVRVKRLPDVNEVLRGGKEEGGR